MSSKFQEGSLIKIDKHLFITRDGMEFLTGKTEKEVTELH